MSTGKRVIQGGAKAKNLKRSLAASHNCRETTGDVSFARGGRDIDLWNREIFHVLEGPRWQSGNTLASHLCSRGSIPVMAVSGKAGSCLPLVGSLQYTTLANSMYWFPLPFQLPVVI